MNNDGILLLLLALMAGGGETYMRTGSRPRYYRYFYLALMAGVVAFIFLF